MRNWMIARAGRIGLMACAAFVVQTASAQEGDDRAEYCYRVAEEYCFNTYGYLTFECQQEQVNKCLNEARAERKESGLVALNRREAV